MRLLKSFIIFSLCAICGCGPQVPVVKMDELNAETKRAVDNVTIYNEQQLSGKDYSIINIVEGISCKNKTWDPAATKTDAIFQARYWALQIGADGITNIQCDQPRGTTTTYNCWESITCTAEAIKFK